MNIPFNPEVISGKLAEFGFKKVKEEDCALYFSRGSILGDLSVRLTKVSLSVRKNTTGNTEIAVQAGWVAAFDSGDHWQLTRELTTRLEEI